MHKVQHLGGGGSSDLLLKGKFLLVMRNFLVAARVAITR